MSTTAPPLIQQCQAGSAGRLPADAGAWRQRILRSRSFARGQGMRELLHFLVQKKLSGSQRDTREHAVGTEVFQRDPMAWRVPAAYFSHG